MEYFDYQNKIKELDEEIIRLKAQRNALKDEFIQNCNPFKIGGKYRITFPQGDVETGIVDSVYVDSDFKGNYHIIPILSKITKSGAAHKTAKVYCPSYIFNELKIEEIL
jgi:hypothetical protein